MKTLQYHAHNPAGTIFIVHDGESQVAEVERENPSEAEAYAQLFTASSQLLYQLEVAIFELERCTGLEEALKPMRAAVAAAKAGAA